MVVTSMAEARVEGVEGVEGMEGVDAVAAMAAGQRIRTVKVAATEGVLPRRFRGLPEQ